jgi:hypothetical protein
MTGARQHRCQDNREQQLAPGEQQPPALQPVQVRAEYRAGDQGGNGERGDQQASRPRLAGPGDDQQRDGDRGGVDREPRYRRRSKQRATPAADSRPGRPRLIRVSSHAVSLASRRRAQSCGYQCAGTSAGRTVTGAG